MYTRGIKLNQKLRKGLLESQKYIISNKWRGITILEFITHFIHQPFYECIPEYNCKDNVNDNIYIMKCNH